MGFRLSNRYPVLRDSAMAMFNKRARNTPVRISIEGNIATGKSTFIKILEDAANDEDWEITPEPVSQWTQIDGEQDPAKASGGNLLELFYNDPKRWSYTFQSYALLSRMRLQREPFGPECQARLSERSIHSDRYIFARNCFETGLMTETEWAIYQEWSSYLLNSLGELRLDGFIYLRADPKICSSRMAKRGRPEEQGVTIDYLNQLHEKHEAWLHRREFSNENIMSDIPILEIDCNVEFHDDEAIKKSMLDQVRDFVKKLQAAKRAEIEKEIEKMDDSGISRSTTPTSSRGESVSPIPFADIKQANKENVQQQSDVKQLCT